MNSPRTYLFELNSSVIRLGLEPVKKLLSALQNPQDSYPSILVGGTNGKGSIAVTISAILRAAGYRVGLYTSPHLVDLRERIRVNDTMIADEELDNLIDVVRSHINEDLTYFEFLTAIAFLYFQKKQVDVAVLEVGLGGRLDATNVVTPLISIISNISLEHQEYLGYRLSDIAREKAGIIPQGGTCLTAAKQAAALDVINSICEERSAKLYRLGKHINVRRHSGGTFSYKGIDGKKYSRLYSNLKGRHQIENTALAVTAIELLNQRGLPVCEKALLQGLESTTWEGRLEILGSAPQIVLDGGHNPAGIKTLCRTLQDSFAYRNLILIFGVLHDKNFKVMMKLIAPLAHIVIITKPESERAVPPSALRDLADSYCSHVEVVEEPVKAFERSMELAAREDMICVAGSLYLIGAIKKYLATNNKVHNVVKT